MVLAFCRDKDICNSVYPTLILGYTELSNFKINVKNEATIGALGYDITIGRSESMTGRSIVISYSVRLRVARSTLMGNAKALYSGTSNRYRLSRYFFILKNNLNPVSL